MMRYVTGLCALLLLAACSAESGTVGWCEEKKEQPKTEWSASDLGTFTRYCLIEGSAVGSERWCRKQKDTPKAQWTAESTATFARYCIM